MARGWNGSCEDWLHGDEHWNHDIVEEEDDSDDYEPVDDEELAEILEKIRVKQRKEYWLYLQREYPAIERTKA